MADERSDLERRLFVDAAELDDAGSPEASIAAALSREAAEAIGEARRALESVRAWYGALEMIEESPRTGHRDAPSVMREVRAALARLGGGE